MNIVRNKNKVNILKDLRLLHRRRNLKYSCAWAAAALRELEAEKEIENDINSGIEMRDRTFIDPFLDGIDAYWHGLYRAKTNSRILL